MKGTGFEQLHKLMNREPEYLISVRIWQEYHNEMQTWLPYPEKKLGPLNELIPFIVVLQQNKANVRPVLNFRELNGYVDT